jgi:hypothetical protein
MRASSKSVHQFHGGALLVALAIFSPLYIGLIGGL